LKLQTVANCVTTPEALVLDSKNIFVEPTDIDSWGIHHGNGRYRYTKDLRDGSTPHLWVNYVSGKLGLPIPKRLPLPLETPWICDPKIMRKVVDNPDLETLFLNDDGVVPMTEVHLYYFYLNDEDLAEERDKICSAIKFDDKPNDVDYAEFIQREIDRCVKMNSAMHGLHRRTRKEMTTKSKEIYEKWLTSIGLDSTMVKDYVYYMMTDTSWGIAQV
jgi:hypothetical protein